ncbi:MAG: hypothetical protein FJ023_03775 [Chloroflexi bacterium]|nr:hypothetical protein [Chloroflexota bacterium]
MKKVFLFGLLLLLISGLALSSLACWPTSTTTETTTTSVPTIVAFSATSTDITEGESTTLLWNVTNATSIQIDQNVGSGLAAAGTTSVSPSSSTTYTLTASNSAGSVTQSVTVTVTSSTSTTPPPALPPNIVVFDISPNTIHHPPGPGPNKAVMRWEVQNAASVTINGISESHSGNRILTPALGTHTYTLRATNAQGTVTRVQVLHVVP